MGGKGVEPLRTFVHTVLSRARLPFRHPPITRYIIEYFSNCFHYIFSGPKCPCRGAVFYTEKGALKTDFIFEPFFHFPVQIPLFEGFALIKQVFAFGYGQLYFGPPFFEIHFHRHQRIAFYIRLGG